MSLRRQAERQFGTSGTLHARMETHRTYSERQTDLDATCRAIMQLVGDESILDVGCGPGLFLSSLREHEHRGRLVGFDQSAAMIAEASERDASIEWLVGDATTPPFGDGTFNWIVARHVLFFIDDLQCCLQELARVAGPHGALLAMTNARRPWPMMWQLLQDALAAHNIETADHLVRDFSIETAPALLGAAFGDVEAHVLDNAFIFTTPGPIAAYLGTLLPSIDATRDPAMRAELLTWIGREAQQRLNDLGGVWRDPKPVGVYLCRNPGLSGSVV